ncbi:MAG: energy-coupling factor ABC transporter ATP-binding protein, partial [Eubacteriales bacterium]
YNHDRGVTIVFSTHDVDLAYSWADQIIVMKDGAVIGSGSPGQIFDDEALLEQADINRPLLLDIGLTLKKTGCLAGDAPIPRTREELLKNLSGSARGRLRVIK